MYFTFDPKNAIIIALAFVALVLVITKVKIVFGAAPDKLKKFDSKIVFHQAAVNYPEHGRLIVTNRSLNLKNDMIRFSFVGLEIAPPLTITAVHEIYEQAASEGYVVHEIYTYGVQQDIVDRRQAAVAEATTVMARARAEQKVNA